MIRETSAPDSTVIIISSPGRGTGVRSELSIVQLRAISGVALGFIVEVWSDGMWITNTRLHPSNQGPCMKRLSPFVRLPGAMVARLASIADGTKRLQVRVLRWSFFSLTSRGFLSSWMHTELLLEAGICKNFLNTAINIVVHHGVIY
jgi:hypothetical protein